MINFGNIEVSLRGEIADGNGEDSCDMTNVGLLELITSLRQAEKDAARYLWLKGQPWFECEAEWSMPINLDADGYSFSEAINAVIDEAMNASNN